MTPLILASTSPYRKQLLERLGLPYQTAIPKVCEDRQPGESAQALVVRLAEAKARSVAIDFPQALIIGSDQVAVLRHATTGSETMVGQEQILGKPGHHQGAVAQLRQVSGRQVDFFTGICVYNASLARAHTELVPYCVTFRELPDDLIERYLQREQPYDCAGSFKSEGLGIILFERLAGDDPTALIGLPLLALRRLLQREQFEII